MNKADMIISRIKKIQKPDKPVIVAIDGRCASGKTTLAHSICEMIDCNVIHMDDFFLRPHQRSVERLNEPGGNIDYERFLAEVLQPLEKGIRFSYRPYHCHTADFGESVIVDYKSVVIIEGSYSCHPKFTAFYDLRFFLDVVYDEQLRRIKLRNGNDALEKFVSMWIPLEERYFSEYKIKETCELL